MGEREGKRERQRDREREREKERERETAWSQLLCIMYQYGPMSRKQHMAYSILI